MSPAPDRPRRGVAGTESRELLGQTLKPPASLGRRQRHQNLLHELVNREPHAGCPLRGRLRGLYSLRVGSYRIIYQLTDNDKTVRVATIRHRSVAYSRDPR
jgi:mRNA-degrading endonuclease RelE of RelBE toxin-antitoxin system